MHFSVYCEYPELLECESTNEIDCVIIIFIYKFLPKIIVSFNINFFHVKTFRNIYSLMAPISKNSDRIRTRKHKSGIYVNSFFVQLSRLAVTRSA